MSSTPPAPHHLRAIETTYRGYRFRSRLEARWAVFFDALNVRWEYEKEGFELDGIRYLPDFWLPEQNCWVEIKGPTPDEVSDEVEKAKRLARASGKQVYILCGAFDLAHPQTILNVFYRADKDFCGVAYCMDIARCPLCGRVSFTVGGQLGQSDCGCLTAFSEAIFAMIAASCQSEETIDNLSWQIRLFDVDKGNDLPSIRLANLKAQQARFEFGENGGYHE